jgi:hypothetical protein
VPQDRRTHPTPEFRFDQAIVRVFQVWNARSDAKSRQRVVSGLRLSPWEGLDRCCRTDATEWRPTVAA